MECFASQYHTKAAATLGHIWSLLSKTIMLTWWLMFICMQKMNSIPNLSACRKLTSSLTFFFFLKYCKDIANLLFRELWDCLTIINQSINLQQAFTLVCMQKINFITYFFLNLFQRNSKLVILVNLDMYGHTHLKW